MKIRSLGAKLFHTDGRTDGWTNGHDEGNSRFSQFCECAKNCCVTIHPSVHLYTAVQTSRHVQYIAANENYAMRMFYHTVQHAKQSMCMSDNTTKENRSEVTGFRIILFLFVRSADS